MNRKGFTLIELMIVIAIIAIIAAIAIPGILAATRAANERNASASLKQFVSIQITFKSSNSDNDQYSDYWTSDVAGLYYTNPVSNQTASTMIKMIELSVALADADPAANYGGSWGVAAHSGSSKAGYWYHHMDRYQTAAATFVNYITDASTDRWGIIAAPNTYPSSGKLAFIVNEEGTMWKRDVQDDAAVWSTKPTSPAQDPAAVFVTDYGTYPLNPQSNGVAGSVSGPWSKMD